MYSEKDYKKESLKLLRLIRDADPNEDADEWMRRNASKEFMKMLEKKIKEKQELKKQGIIID